MKDKEAVVFVHGIWMRGLELFYLRFKLRQNGYQVYQFSYPSLFNTPEQNAKNLYKFVSKIDEPVIHFVAHSLGGIIVSHLFNNYDLEKTGKVIFIGTPINGSVVASHLSKKKFLKILLGKSVINGLLGDGPSWKARRQTCVIAGTKRLGVGMLLAKNEMQQQNDGTVNLSETKIQTADETHVVPSSHFLMLWSSDVVEKINAFLEK